MDAAGIRDTATRETLEHRIEMLICQVSGNAVTDRLFALRGRERFVDRPRPQGRRKESPLEFIERVYPDRRQFGLRRLDLAELDSNLYGSLNAWLSQHKKAIPAEFGLPSKREYTDAQIKAFGFTGESPKMSEASAEAREVLRAYCAAKRRERIIRNSTV